MRQRIDRFLLKSCLTTARLAVLGMFALVPLAASAAPGEVPTAKLGHGTAGTPRTVYVDALPQITAAEVALQPKRLPFRGAKGAETKQPAIYAKGSALSPTRNPSGGDGLKTPGAGKVYPGATEVGCGNVTPADQAVAVGDTPVGVLHAINVCYEVFNVAGVLQSGYPKSLTSLVGLAAGTPVSDPRLLYDWVNRRYILVFIQFDPNFASASTYWIAVSTSDSPTGSFCTYNLGVQSVGVSGGVYPLPDFPRLGQDRDAIYLASNIFNPNYNSEEILMLPKSALYSCSGFSFNYFSNLTLGGVHTDTTQPANTFDVADNPKSEILVTSKNINFGCGTSTPCNGLVVWSIHSPLSSPSLAGIVLGTGNNYAYPPAANQPGGANTIDTGDARISGMAMAAAGSVYASINTANGSNPAYILYQIQPFLDANGNITSARMLNEIFHGNSTSSFYYATQQPDPQGNVTTVFNFSDANNYAGLAYASRRVTQAPGTEPDGGIFLRTGQGFYNQGRWGDYTAVAPAAILTKSPVMFFGGMVARSNDTWGTFLGENGYSSIDQNSPTKAAAAHP